MGWMDTNTEFNNATIVEDLAELPSELTAGLDNLDACVVDMLEAYVNHE